MGQSNFHDICHDLEDSMRRTTSVAIAMHRGAAKLIA
jgi:hypothetical protein